MAMRLFNLSGVVRVDYLFDIKKKKLYLNEINSVPGSLAYYFWAKDGININELVKTLVNIAKENKAQKFNLNAKYSVSLF